MQAIPPSNLVAAMKIPQQVAISRVVTTVIAINLATSKKHPPQVTTNLPATNKTRLLIIRLQTLQISLLIKAVVKVHPLQVQMVPKILQLPSL